MAAGNPLSSIADILGVGGTVTTTIGLAALSLLVAFLAVRHGQSAQRSTVADAIASGDNRMLRTVIGDLDLSLDDLSPDQKFNLASHQLAHRARARIFVYAGVLFGALALMAVVVILALHSRPRLLDTTILKALSRVPAEQRVDLCLALADTERCAGLASIFAALRYVPPTAEESVVVDVAQAGSVTKAQLRELSKLPFANVVNSQGGGSQLYLGTVPSTAGDILQVRYDCTGMGGQGVVRFGVAFDGPNPRFEEALQGPFELRSVSFRGEGNKSYALFARTRGPFSCQVRTSSEAGGESQ